MTAVLFILAALMLALIPLAPTLLRLRIRILRWIRWHWMADLLEGQFDRVVVFVRVVLLVCAIALCVAGLGELGD
jgi:hypothetical protein